MTNRGVMKEIRIEIQSELAMNIVHYLMSEEGYVYVGNERDVWLENLSHPTVQLIYLNQRSMFNEEQTTQLFKQVHVIRARLRRRYLMGRLNVLILNINPIRPHLLNDDRHYLKVIDINEASDFKKMSSCSNSFLICNLLSLSNPWHRLWLRCMSRQKRRHFMSRTC